MPLAVPGLLSVVAITVTGPRAVDAEDRVVESCAAALGAGACALAASDAPSPFAAQVFLEPEGVRAVLSTDDGVTLERELAFTEADGVEQRWVASGLLVAAMIAAVPRKEEPVEEPPVAEPKVPEPPVEAKAPALAERATTPPPEPPKADSRRFAYAMDVGLLGTQALSWGQWCAGAELRQTILGSSGWGVAGMVRGANAVDAEPSLLLLGVGIGPMVRLTPTGRPFEWWVALEGVAEIVEIAPGDGSEPGARSAYRFGLGVDTRLSLGSGDLVPWLGVSAALKAPEIVVRVNGDDVGETDPWSVAFLLGARARIFE